MTFDILLSHPVKLAPGSISSGWLLDTAVCHPDDISYHHMSSGWLSRNWYIIRMSYDNVIMSSGWHPLPLLSHPDEIANFDFPQHAVALQRFRTLSLGSLSERAVCPGYGKTTSFDFILQIEMQTPWNRNGSFYLDIADLNVSLDTGCTPSVWYILDNLSATKASGSELAAIIAHGEPPVA